MSVAINQQNVQKAIEDAGEAWLFNFWSENRSEHLEGIRKQIQEFVEEYERRFGERPDPFALFESDLPKAKAFFQNDTFMVSSEMKIMIWRVLVGCEILRVEFVYEISKEPSLVIRLRTPEGAEELHHGVGAWDFKVLRHFGAAVRSGCMVPSGLVLQGYYAVRRS
jgi:hypothetical protein